MSLNPNQFRIPGMRQHLPVIQPKVAEPGPEWAADYGSAHDDDRWGTDWVDNDALVTPTKTSRESNDRIDKYTRSQEMVPSWRVASTQAEVNPAAVAHQVRHADPAKVPPLLISYTYDDHEVGHDEPVEHYVLGDGNHRANAALDRGQLLVDAAVPGRRPSPDEKARRRGNTPAFLQGRLG